MAEMYGLPMEEQAPRVPPEFRNTSGIITGKREDTLGGDDG